MVVAVAGLEGPLGAFAGLSLIGLLGLLFTVFLRMMLKTADRADENNAAALRYRDETIKDLRSELAEVKKERDLWFSRFVDNQLSRKDK